MNPIARSQACRVSALAGPAGTGTIYELDDRRTLACPGVTAWSIGQNVVARVRIEAASPIAASSRTPLSIKDRTFSLFRYSANSARRLLV